MKLKKLFLDYLPMAAIGVLIIVFAVLNEQSFFKTLPTIVTLFVMLLVARTNRYAFLLGGINAVIYGLSYLSDGLYFSVISAIAISAPIQLYSFFTWTKKRDRKKDTELKRLSIPQLFLVTAIILAGWALCYFGLLRFFDDALYPSFDTYLFSSGIVYSLLVAFRYIESQYFNTVACVVSIIMWILICIDSPNNMNYLIISLYNLFMVVKAAISWSILYSKQQKAKVSIQ